MDTEAFKQFLIALIEEEFGPKPCEIAPRWQGGTIVLNPNNESQSKEFPIEVFFKKLMSIRDSLRVLEQKINGNESLSQNEKVSLQSYITKAYGSLTTFNILFKDGKDKFVGSGSAGKSSSQSKMTLAEAQKKLGLNEY